MGGSRGEDEDGVGGAVEEGKEVRDEGGLGEARGDDREAAIDGVREEIGEDLLFEGEDHGFPLLLWVLRILGLGFFWG